MSRLSVGSARRKLAQPRVARLVISHSSYEMRAWQRAASSDFSETKVGLCGASASATFIAE
jgi:hypothetical protein